MKAWTNSLSVALIVVVLISLVYASESSRLKKLGGILQNEKIKNGCPSVTSNMVNYLFTKAFPAKKTVTNDKDQFGLLLRDKFKGKESAVDEMMEFYDQIVDNEKAYCATHIPVYFGAGFSGAFISELRSCMPARTKTTDTIFQRYTDLMAQANKEVLDKKMSPTDGKDYIMHFDRIPYVAINMQSVSVTIASTASSESATDFYINGRNVNFSPDKLISAINNIFSDDHDKAEKLTALVTKYVNQVKNAMVQVLIKKEDLNNIAYLSQPYGIAYPGLNKPISVDFYTKQPGTEMYLEKLAGGPAAFFTYCSLNGGGNGRKISGFYPAKTWNTPDYYNILQARVLVTSVDYSNPDKVIRIPFYPASQAVAAKAMQDEIAVICHGGASASVSDTAHPTDDPHETTQDSHVTTDSHVTPQVTHF